MTHKCRTYVAFSLLRYTFGQAFFVQLQVLLRSFLPVELHGKLEPSAVMPRRRPVTTWAEWIGKGLESR